MRSSRVVLCAVLLVVASVAPGFAQQTGDIQGRVADPSGAALPGVTITLTGVSSAPRRAASSHAGTFWFPRLPVGSYDLTFEADGLKPVVVEGVRVAVNATATVKPVLGAPPAPKVAKTTGSAPAAGPVTWRALEPGLTPVMDTTRAGTQEGFSRGKLQFLPTARDPWAMLERTPGVLLDRPNVGGNLSGRQGASVSRGSSRLDNSWAVDGVDITDLSTAGTSPIYFDFDMLDEMQVVTSGADVSQQAGGVGINVVTRSGSDTFKGSSRFYFTGQRFLGNNFTDAIKQQRGSAGNPIQNIKDYGLELGGPVVKGRLWYWGSFATQHLNTGISGFYLPTEKCQAVKTAVTANALVQSVSYVEDGKTKTYETTTGNVRRCFTTDSVDLDNYNWKLNWAVSLGNRVSLQNTWAARTNAASGASDTRPAETTAYREGPASSKYGTYGWDVGPSPLWKAGDQQVFTDRLLLDVQWSHLGNNTVFDFQDDAQDAVQRRVERSTGVYSGSFDRLGPYIRPATSAEATLSYFLPGTLGGNHAFTAGARYRTVKEHAEFHVGGNTQARFENKSAYDATLYRDSVTDYELKTATAYLQDTFTRGKWTARVGARWDRQSNKALPSSIPAHPFAPEWLPAVTFRGADGGADWNDVSPRVGVTYDVRGAGKTVARASWAVYYGQRSPQQGVSPLNPATAAEITFPWSDLNGDQVVQANELDYGTIKSYGGNYDPKNPTRWLAPGSVDAAVKNSRTQELIVGLDRTFSTFAVGASYIYRKYDRFQWNDTLNFTSADYSAYQFAPGAGSCPQASARCPTLTYYEPDVQIPAEYVYTNRPDYSRTFNGVELTARKRFANRWSLDASYAYNSAVDNYASASAFEDPTHIGQLNGAQYALETGGSESENVFINAKWVVRLSGVYALPRGVTMGAVYNARQGYLMPQYVLSPDRWNGAGTTRLYVDQFGDVRYSRLQMVDIRFDKALEFRKVRIIPSIDILNLLNVNTVIARRLQQNSAAANTVAGIVAPRVIRFGIRASW